MRTPYHTEFLQDFKTLIPGRQRTWNPDDKIWHIRPSAVDDVIALCKTWFSDNVEVVFCKREGSHQRTDTGPHGVLFVQEGAPREVVEAAYKALARLHHPDKGGDTKTMQAINAAYDRITDG